MDAWRRLAGHGEEPDVVVARSGLIGGEIAREIRRTLVVEGGVRTDERVDHQHVAVGGRELLDLFDHPGGVGRAHPVGEVEHHRRE